MARGRRRVLAVVVVLVIFVVAGTLVAALAPSPHQAHRVADRSFPAPVSQPSPSVASGSKRFTPVPPATVVPEQSPVQAQYDQALSEGLGSSATVHAAEASGVPAPAFAGGWGPLPVTYDPSTWTERVVHALLDINFARQSRAGLGSWLSAEEAPEVLPGVPAAIEDKVLYLSLFDTTAMGGGTSAVPSAGAGVGPGGHARPAVVTDHRRRLAAHRRADIGFPDLEGARRGKVSIGAGHRSQRRKFEAPPVGAAARWQPRAPRRCRHRMRRRLGRPPAPPT